jgi:hypothetical protein
MDSLLSLLAAPVTARAAFEAVGKAAFAATKPFAEVLAALSPAADASADDGQGPAIALPDELVDRLQELLAAAGVEPGQYAAISYDPITGRVDVDHASPLAGNVAAAIEQDEALMDQLQALAEAGSGDDPLELLVETVWPRTARTRT